MTEVVILGAIRTPIGRFMGKLSSISAPDLGAYAIKALLGQTGVPASEINEVIMGNVLGAGVGQAPARQAALKAGLPETVSALTINKVCGSGLQAVMSAAALIRAGDADVVVAGGMESMSNVPFYLPSLRQGNRLGNTTMVDGLIYDGLRDSFHGEHMGCFADYTAEKSGVSREEQDAFAFESHKKAVAAANRLSKEIVAVEVRDNKGNVVEVVSSDEGPRPESSVDKLAKLRPAFSASGTVTPGNASTINDGAAALLMASREWADANGLQPLARVTAYATSGVPPKEIFFAPGYAVQMILKKLGVSDISYFDLLEINEAFAAQVLANERQVGWDRSRLNIFGGAIALGHPIGASGARVLVTLLNALATNNKETGIAALCLGGGNAVALSVARE